jgi:hypothetical protein
MKTKIWLLRGIAGLLAVCMVLATISVVINRNLPTHSEAVDQLGKAEKARLAEFYQVRPQLGDAVWPGWGTAAIPVIVYNEAYAFLVGYPDPPDGWVKVPQNEWRGGPWTLVPNDLFSGDPYYRQQLPATGEIPEAFTVRVGDRWVASMLTMEWMEITLANQFRRELPPFLAPIFPYSLVTTLFLRGSDGYISALAHESFHAYQGTIAPERLAAAEAAVSLSESDYPWTDSAFQEAWQIELDLLAEAVQADTEVEIAPLAQQFLAQRALRRQKAGLTAALTDYERQREWLEGLARYVELEIWRQASLAEAYEPAAALLDDPDFSGYATFDRRWSQEIDQMGRMADDEGDGRFYYSGMAQAVLLDRLMPAWKNQALAEGVFLEDLLATALPGLPPNKPAPFLVIDLSSDRLWTPFYGRATVKAQLYYADDGDAPWPLEEPVVFRESPAVKASGEFTLVDTTWGLIAKPAYTRRLAQMLAQAIASALQNDVFRLPQAFSMRNG